jgi:hypothetical protein
MAARGHGQTADRTLKVAPWENPPLTRGNAVEPPIGIEPMTYALRDSPRLMTVRWLESSTAEARGD